MVRGVPVTQTQHLSTTRRAMLKAGGAIGLLFGGGLFGAVAQARSLRVGQPAPPAVLVTLDGTRIATQDLLGRVVILTFWATYCAPCRDELPLLSDYVAEHAGDGLSVLAFSVDGPEQVPAVRKIARSLSFPVGFMTEESAPGYGRIWRMPANFTIGRDGRLVENGWDMKDCAWTRELALEKVVTPLLTAV